MRHRVAGRHLSRTSAHRLAMRRNMAQSLIQFGQIRTTLVKAKDVRPFVERIITLARTDAIDNRRRVTALLGDRAVIAPDQQEAYDGMTDARRRKVRFARSGRRHRTGAVPASYNKKKIPFVARSVVNKLFEEVAPRYRDRPGGYTRIIRLAKRRIGDNGELAILQLVGEEEKPTRDRKKTVGRRRQTALNRIRALEGGKKRQPRRGGRTTPAPKPADAAPDGVTKDADEAANPKDEA